MGYDERRDAATDEQNRHAHRYRTHGSSNQYVCGARVKNTNEVDNGPGAPGPAHALYFKINIL